MESGPQINHDDLFFTFLVMFWSVLKQEHFAVCHQRELVDATGVSVNSVKAKSDLCRKMGMGVSKSGRHHLHFSPCRFLLPGPLAGVAAHIDTTVYRAFCPGSGRFFAWKLGKIWPSAAPEKLRTLKIYRIDSCWHRESTQVLLIVHAQHSRGRLILSFAGNHGLLLER